MQNSHARSILIGCIALVYLLVISVVILSDTGASIQYTVMKICALSGFLSLSCAVLMNLNKPYLQQILGKPFLPVHHLFAFGGFILITLHPLLFVLMNPDLTIIFPDTASPVFFPLLWGKVAILVVYLVLIAALLRNSLKSHWKFIHRFIYPALLIAYIHASVIGSNFSHPAIWIIYTILIVLIIITGVIRMNRRRKKRMASN
jgi:DMSO/TMAO reductase YedYZ heme-binding membrane subunit